MLRNQRVIAPKKNELHFSADPQMLPINAFQCRAGKYRVLFCSKSTRNLLTQKFQPRPSVLIRQRTTATHLLDICAWMKIICFIKLPAKLFGEQFTNRGFPCSRNAENNHDHGELVCRRLPIFSIKNATSTKSV
jgi:hypothetical protein